MERKTGLARALPSSQQQHSGLLTSTIVGTGPYMAPEVIGGTITSAADIYAFGVSHQDLTLVLVSPSFFCSGFSYRLNKIMKKKLRGEFRGFFLLLKKYPSQFTS